MIVDPPEQLPKKRGYIQISILVMLAFCSAFFPRVLLLIKFPSLINIVHLGIVPWVCFTVLTKTRTRDQKQIDLIWNLLIALLCFLSINLASALNGEGGAVNAFVNFLLLCEHFLLLISILSLPLTAEKFFQFRALIIFSSFTNTAFAYAQKYIFKLHLQHGLEDNIKGVFIKQGAGHVVGASVALTFGLYYLATAKNVPIWLRILVLGLTFEHMSMADAKQVMLVFGIGAFFFILSKFSNVIDAIKYIVASVFLGTSFIWAIQNVPSLKAFNTWIRPEIYGPNGEATLLKSATLRIVPRYYDTWIDPLLGLGPGHTVGRLGGWMLKEYESLLMPLGATTHAATRDVWRAVAESWLGDQSSMFSPLFGWAGIWGDLGWLGLGAFLYIWWLVWHYVCKDDVSKYLMLTILSFGLIFSQMEEPGYMLYVTSLIGIQWHDYRLRRQGKLPSSPGKIQKPLPRTWKAWGRMLLRLPETSKPKP